MTPKQRRDARDWIRGMKDFEAEHGFHNPATTWFESALDQMDADEGLMRQMLEAFHKKVVWQWRREFGIRTCISCHSTQDAGHQRDCAVAAVLDALRARLGEVPAQGEEADDGEAKG